jgi:hypothetical protein
VTYDISATHKSSNILLTGTEFVTDLDLQSEMIIFGSTLTTFETSIIFGGRRGSIKNLLESKTNLQFSQIPEKLCRKHFMDLFKQNFQMVVWF